MRGRGRLWLSLLAFFSLSGGLARGEEAVDAALEQVDVEEKLGDKVPGDVALIDERGNRVTLEHYLHRGHPVVLNLLYYECPMLCSMVLNGFVQGLKDVDLMPGREFDIVTVSIDPTETSELAAAKREGYLRKLGREGAGEGWHFHTAAQADIDRLAASVGFKYRYDEKQEQYAHPAVLFVLTEDGVVSRYLYGIQYKPQDLRLSLLEAAAGTIGTSFDRLLLFCYHFDPKANSYVLAAMNVMRLGGVVTVILLAAILFPVWLKGGATAP